MLFVLSGREDQRDNEGHDHQYQQNAEDEKVDGDGGLHGCFDFSRQRYDYSHRFFRKFV